MLPGGDTGWCGEVRWEVDEFKLGLAEVRWDDEMEDAVDNRDEFMLGWLGEVRLVAVAGCC